MNRYNALLQKLTTKLSDKEIYNSGFFRGTQYGKANYKQLDSWGRMMRDLVFPAKITVLSVCDGYFVNNPNKNYA